MISIPFRPRSSSNTGAPETQTIQAILVGAAVWAVLIVLALSAPETTTIEADARGSDQSKWVPIRY